MDVCDRFDVLNSLSSDSDADSAVLEEILFYSLSDDQVNFSNHSISKKKPHEQFMMSNFSYDVYPEYFGVTRDQFEDIHEMIEDGIYSNGCNAKQPIGTEEKLGVFLRYLVTGDSYRNIAVNFKLADRTVANIVRVVAAKIWIHMKPMYLKEPTIKTWDSIAAKFEQEWKFPHCVGVIGGKHVIVGKPGKNGSFYTRYKHTSSVLLLVTVDADYKFTSVDIGAVKKFGERDYSFHSSELGKKIANGSMNLPEPRKKPPLSHPLPFVFLGDETFPLAENLMKPYRERIVKGNKEYEVFNSRLSNARRPVECAFGMAASKFHVLRKSFESRVDSVKDVVKAACVLHNYLRCTATDQNVDIDQIEPLSCYQLLPMHGGNVRYSDKVHRVREQFTEYLSSVVEGR